MKKIYLSMIMLLLSALLLTPCFSFPSIPVDISVDIPIVGDYLKIAQDINNALNVFTEGYTPEQEYYLGRTCAANILYKYDNGLTENDDIQKYINEIGQTLAVMSGRDDLFSGYIFIVIQGNNKNAIATPGGFIFITTAMVEACDNEDQIAGILSHEIAHVVHKDAINSISSKNRLISMIKLAEKYGGPAAKQKAQEALNNLPDWFVVEITNTSMDQIFSSIVDEMVNLWENAYSEDQEKAADIYAVHLMASSGYNPDELVNIIRKLDEGVDGHYGAHPSPNVRISYITEEITTLSVKPETLQERIDRIVR